jgi:1-acyl-sn-glycerol-3-phosphate acyltransferase
MGSFRAGLRLALIVLWTLPLASAQRVLLRVRFGDLDALPQLWHRGMLKIIGLKVRQIGTIAMARPVLFVVNHISWLDILVLGSLLEGAFIAKGEIAAWPILGWLAKCQRTVFIERKWRRTRDHKDLMIDWLKAGKNLILFAEGTSSDGLRLLPFKSAFFVLAETKMAEGPIKVQPVSLGYNRLDNMPIGRRLMPTFAWVGDSSLPAHFWRYLKAGSAEAVVEFHTPVTIERFASRKGLAAHSRTVIAQGLSDIHAGRKMGPRTMPPAGQEPIAPPAPPARMAGASASKP